MKAYCDKVEWDSILRDSIYLNPRQFVEGLRDGKSGVYDETIGKKINPHDLILLVDGEAVERYIRQNPKVSMQSKINMLNDRLINKIKEEFLGKGVKYTEPERKAILKAYRGRYGGKVWKGSIYELYRKFLELQALKGKAVDIPADQFDVYDLAALAYLYKRIKETDVISEAHHIVIDEAQDFGMMAYSVLHFCIKDCTYTVMGDVSQNIHFGFGLNDWDELRALLLPDEMDSFGILKKSYRNTVEISDFATGILHHGSFSSYPVEPIIRHGSPVTVLQKGEEDIIKEAADICKNWQKNGYETIAIVCRNQRTAAWAAKELEQYIEVMESDLERAVFGTGIMVLPVEYTKGLEFDTVLILDPTRAEYPVDDGHAKLLYVAATRALHELCVLHTQDLTGLIADPIPEKRQFPEKLPKRDENSVQTPKTDIKQQRPYSQESNFDKIPGQRAQNSGLLGKPRVSITQYSPQNKWKSQEQSVRQQGISLPGNPGIKAKQMPVEPKSASTLPAFGDIPPTEKLRPPGHGKIDLSIRLVMRHPDGLYLQSRYGTLRLSPVGSAIMRISFVRQGQPYKAVHPGISVDRTEKFWMYRDSSKIVELTTDELALQVDKATGAIRYLALEENQKAPKLLLAERARDCRQLEPSADKSLRTWLYFDWAKDEHLYSFGGKGQPGVSLRGSSRYISRNQDGLPFFLSDKGYGILAATSGPAFLCDIPAYGSYLYAENHQQMDFYFIAGRRQDTILNACAYLCGAL